MSVSNGATTLGLQLIGAGSGRVSVTGDTAAYDTTLPGVRVSYQAQASGLKDTLTLTDRGAPAVFRYRAELSPGAGLAPDGAGACLCAGRTAARCCGWTHRPSPTARPGPSRTADRSA